MIKKTWWMAALLAGGMAGMVTPTLAARAVVDLTVDLAPPIPRSVTVPPPRQGYRWSPGYWNWRENRHVWVSGVWMRERPGYAYTEPRWTESGGRWHLARGGWKRHDRDHDGVPNAVDAHPANPARP